LLLWKRGEENRFLSCHLNKVLQFFDIALIPMDTEHAAH